MDKILAILILLMTLVSCTEEDTDKISGPERVKPFQTGIASWYGPGFDGRKTANGEIFDQNKMTAAHRTIKFGTYVLVRNTDNNKTVVVKINDRGPVSKKRIIDVSKAAARKLEFVDKGLANVEIYIVSEAKTPNKLLNDLTTKIYQND